VKDVVAHLALATGTIEVKPPGATDWQVMATGASIAPDSRIRTGENIRCEVVMADDSTIRLNGNTEVSISAKRNLDLKQGQMWSSVSPGAIPFTVAVAQANILAIGTQFDIVANPQQPEATLTVIEGSTKIVGKGGERVVNFGNKVRIIDGTPGEQQTANLLTATRWVNELMMMKGRDNAELQKRVDGLLAAIGNEKMAYMMEDEIKALGDHCVLPLTRYVQSPLSSGPANAGKRRQAARILTEMSQPWSIPYLIELLKDDDGEVRYYSARALQRLVGDSVGRSPEQWRQQPSAGKYNEWVSWWQNNRERYPTGPMGPSPSPTPIPKQDLKAKAGN
jgi:hypothetical protein